MLMVGLESQENWPDVRRLRELSDPSVFHDRMWALNPEHGIIAPPDEKGDALRIRLGAPLINETMLCERCGVVVGRPAVRGNHLLHFVSLADISASIEVPELVLNATTLRPFDVYTDATIPCGKAALDVGICSPDSGSARFDCCESMWSSKRKHYQDDLEAMGRVGLRYSPIVFSCYGRLHVCTMTSLGLVAKPAAKRMGIEDHYPILRKAHAAFGVAI